MTGSGGCCGGPWRAPAVTILGFGGSFGLSPLGTQAFLVLLVFLGLAYSIMRFMLGLFDQGERLLNRGRHLRKRR